ncbi:hypothetical protein [Bradyrhizobium sp.]|uniref:hypothetical protein n=1 Tax=Bradyrhizobium sp. TaxID=376 RepID=UPI003BAE37DE
MGKSLLLSLSRRVNRNEVFKKAGKKKEEKGRASGIFRFSFYRKPILDDTTRAVC